MSQVCQGCGGALEPSRFRPRKWCSEKCRRSTLYGGTCVDCGARTNGNNGKARAPERCPKCSAIENGERRHVEHRALIEAMWADGMTAREIAAIAGWTTRQPHCMISHLRAHGYDLPHRRTPEQIARITAGSADGLAKARAVYRASKAAA